MRTYLPETTSDGSRDIAQCLEPVSSIKEGELIVGYSEGRRGKFRQIAGEAGATVGDFKQRPHFIRVETLAGHTCAPLGIVELAASHGTDAPEDFFFRSWRMTVEPFLKEGSHGPWQTTQTAEWGLRFADMVASEPLKGVARQFRPVAHSVPVLTSGD